MKYYILIQALFIINIYAQFTSGTDYAGQEKKSVAAAGTGNAGIALYSERSELRWELNSVNGGFRASSLMTGLGYGVFSKIPAGDLTVFFSGDHIYKEFTNSASRISTDPDDDNLYIVRVPSAEFNELSARAGAGHKSGLGIYGHIVYFTGDETEDLFRSGLSAEYKMNAGKNNTLTLEYLISSSADPEKAKNMLSYSPVLPGSSLSALLGRTNSDSGFGAGAKYSAYNKDDTGKKSSSYLNFDIRYSKNFTGAKTRINALAGTNLTSEFEAPEIHLPYFYYTAEFGADFISERVIFDIGWNYGLYNSVLGDRIRISDDDLVLIPTGVEKLKGETGAYRLYIKIGVKF